MLYVQRPKQPTCCFSVHKLVLLTVICHFNVYKQGLEDKLCMNSILLMALCVCVLLCNGHTVSTCETACAYMLCHGNSLMSSLA